MQVDPTSSQQAPLGNGMARQAANDLLQRNYRMHVEEAKALGQTPMTPQQFAASQRGA